ncbi:MULTISPECIES: hybrid sensor histidine kinase/response regulator [unclassified Flavobacterium]|uniref:hybrid sensor histidine kinase/response regulator n=1 Tax=unclassified Flavobacterium TaxID=196869 RepID=UPI0025C304AD|nr:MULTISPECIES: hybrid sensor histidine kinase/response regulator [unclassified Flavobacterium]
MKNTEEQTILLIEDNPGDSRLIKEMLNEITSINYRLIIAETLKEGCEEIKKNDFILILLDLNLPDSSGIKTFDTVMNFAEKIPVVLISGMQDVELSLSLIKEGAQDYITKQDINSTLLGKTILFAKERKKLLSELIIANKELAFQNKEKEKRAAELVIAKDHAEQSDRLKSAFLANMSHEIRTPMNGILGFAELLKEPNLTGEEQQEYIEIIEKSGVRMLNIINDIVDISKIEAGLMEVNLTESNGNEQIEYIYTFFKPEVEGKGMQFSYRHGMLSSESIIKTDREKLYAILTNLIKNAIKYTNKGAIEFGYDYVVEMHGRASLQFFVKDTGIGIPKDRQGAIFERFIQADISDKHSYQGAGLGLSISKAYVEMLGGRIWVESEEGKGSTFYFTIPYNTEPEEKNVVGKVVPAQDEENQIKDLKILIAEDDEASEMLISITFKEFSKEILKARNGFEAVEVCRNNPDTDLILMDIQMPVMNGHEATRQIRQFNKDIVIIAQTAFGLSGDREKAIAAGCNDYIAKPINRAELLALIQKHFKY